MAERDFTENTGSATLEDNDSFEGGSGSGEGEVGGVWKVWWKYMRVEMPGRGGKGRGCNGGGGYWVVYTRSYFQSGRLILYN